MNQSMDSTSPLSLVGAEMQAVNDLILKSLHSEVVLVNEVGHYIINSGGKRLRPALVLLSAGACNALTEKATTVSAIIEFIHTATLLHDDVVDESHLRRGRETANDLWGNEASVLVGDFLYSRAFEMMVDVNKMEVMAILASTTNIIAEGEVMQLLNIHDADTTEERYLDVIYSKTAKLFEAATLLGAVLGERPEAERQAMASYGMHLGTAFQLIDDILDYEASEETLGKKPGDDLAEGKPTLPLIHAIKHGSAIQAKLIRRAIEEGDRKLIDDVIEVIHETKSINYTKSVADKETQMACDALSSIPASPYKDALINLAKQATNRDH